ncbi:MAG: hypothetical protein IH631_11275 [Candidatus Thorarchaeota archaeon]|nr:hypothetical protein [Candidatus Thorarchaeota archaeon]
MLNERNNSTHLDKYVPSAEKPSLNLIYYVATNLTEVPVLSNSVIAGDHLTLKAAWTPSVVNRSRLEVFAPAIPSSLTQDLNTHTIEIDTRYLGNNATCTINATAWLINGTIVFQTFVNVYIGNFFVPRVTVTSPNGAEVWSGINNITWTASDINVGDSLRYQVFISSDGGKSFDALVSSITRKWFTWDCSTWDNLDTYLVEVRVTDGIYFSSDRSDSTFTAGGINITTTLPTTTTTTITGATTTTTTTFDPRLTAFMVILVISSSVMAIVVYYAARKWF